MFSILQNPRNVILSSYDVVHNRAIYICFYEKTIYIYFHVKNRQNIFPQIKYNKLNLLDNFHIFDLKYK